MKEKVTLANAMLIFSFLLCSATAYTQATATAVATGNPYPNMPAIAPIGERIEKYITVNESAKGPAIDPKKGYRVQEVGKGLYGCLGMLNAQVRMQM